MRKLGLALLSVSWFWDVGVLGAENRSGSEGVAYGWMDPRLDGGRMIDFTTPRRGEPLNIIISGLSDPRILTDDGFKSYISTIGFAPECLGIHIGARHRADLGDGNGPQVERLLSRQCHFGIPVLGSCLESLIGGFHFRGWRQEESKAWFLGVSKEFSLLKHHAITPDGYNIGRNWFVGRALKGGRLGGTRWTASVEWNADLLIPGRIGINHGIKQDGRVAILTITEVPPEECFVCLVNVLGMSCCTL
ncbi:hypothetical protein SISSUDRAFT_1046551 [Sistotremastrum suecicum HHB10207 ss-3]|uniref:Uncharacterized protein n=1 Tax=Sistotremastrum suecicum HHB10207 ss-3 TaxID=1314776 RepID=A0A166DQL0_9AGAM|nr:hypothetical protein SISSUDRAFT_1046551 [Sistotremastrum suecicum HHB10207 ss-3]